MNSEIEKTLHEFDEDIREVNRLLDDTKKYVEDHPSEGLRVNYMGLKYVLDELKSRREKLLEENYVIYIKGKIEELFEHTQDERFRGGKLKYVSVYDKQYILVEAESRMDANMMQTLMDVTDSKIILGTENNNVLVFKRKKEE